MCLSWSITVLVTLTNFQIDFSIILHGGKKVTREIPIVHLKLSFKDCPYLQVHQLKSFQIQFQLVHNKIEGVSITMKKLKSHLQRNVVLLQRNFVLEF